MNEFNFTSPDNIWIFGVIAVSFLAGCVYRLCTLLARDARNHQDPAALDLSQRYGRELEHVKQLHNELIQARQSVESRALVEGLDKSPEDLGVDPFKLANSGASIKVLMSRCRLSRAEAELVFSVHGAGAGRKPAKVKTDSSAPQQLPKFALTA